MLYIHFHAALRVVTQPEDVLTKPGEKVKFAFKTLPDAYSYQWFFDSNRIEIENKDFDGSTTDHLVLGRCIPRYKGFFMCTATDDTGTSLSSRIATLMIGMKVGFVNSQCVLLHT